MPKAKRNNVAGIDKDMPKSAAELDARKTASVAINFGHEFFK